MPLDKFRTRPNSNSESKSNVTRNIYGLAIMLFATFLATEKVESQCNIQRDSIYKTLIYHPDTQVPEDVKEFTKEYHNQLFGQIQSPLENPVGVAISEVTMPRDIADTFDRLGSLNAVQAEVRLAIQGKSSENNLTSKEQRSLKEWYTSVRESNKSDELQNILPRGYSGYGGLAYSYENFKYDPDNDLILSSVKTDFTDKSLYTQNDTLVSMQNDTLVSMQNDTLVSMQNLADVQVHETAHNFGAEHRNAVVIYYTDEFGNKVDILTTNVAAKTGYYSGVPYFTRKGLEMDSLSTWRTDYYGMGPQMNIQLYNEDMDGNADIMERNMATVFEKNLNLCTSTSLEETPNSDISSSINIYPNPAQDLITIDYPEYDTKYIFIADMTGKVLKMGAFTNNQIDISDLASGIYTVQLWTTDDKVATKKLVITR